MFKVFIKKKTKETDFSKFIRKAPSREKRRVFMRVIKDATNDQRRIMKEKAI